MGWECPRTGECSGARDGGGSGAGDPGKDFVFKAAGVPNGAPKSLDEIEKAHILRTLETVGWNQTGQPRFSTLTGLRCTTN